MLVESCWRQRCCDESGVVQGNYAAQLLPEAASSWETTVEAEDATVSTMVLKLRALKRREETTAVYTQLLTKRVYTEKEPVTVAAANREWDDRESCFSINMPCCLPPINYQDTCVDAPADTPFTGSRQPNKRPNPVICSFNLYTACLASLRSQYTTAPTEHR